jgi:hypothetical protein
MERRRSPRATIELECTLSRHSGTPIAAHTVDLGPGGMCVKCERPLADDELVEFEIRGQRFGGRARVLRQQQYHVYALRFEEVSDTQREALARLASG